MARITVEDCLSKENNRFALVQLAAKRTKQILQGSKILTAEAKTNKAVVSSLREIAEGKVRFMTGEELEAAQVEEQKEAAQKAREALERLTQGINGHTETAAPSNGEIAAPPGGSDDEEDDSTPGGADEE